MAEEWEGSAWRLFQSVQIHLTLRPVMNSCSCLWLQLCRMAKRRWANCDRSSSSSRTIIIERVTYDQTKTQCLLLTRNSAIAKSLGSKWSNRHLSVA